MFIINKNYIKFLLQFTEDSSSFTLENTFIDETLPKESTEIVTKNNSTVDINVECKNGDVSSKENVRSTEQVDS